MKALIPIEQIALNCCSDMGDSNAKLKFTFSRKIMQGYKDFFMYVSQNISVKTAVLQYNNVVTLPCDCVYITKVGLKYRDRIVILSLNRDVQKQKLTQEEAEAQCNEVWNGNWCGEGYTFYNCWNGYNFLGEMYGCGRGFGTAGWYNYNRGEGEIYIGSLVPVGAEIIVEYKSTGIANGLELVPAEIELMLQYFAKSEYYADKNPTLSAINRANYEREYNKVKRQYNFAELLYQSRTMNESFSPTNY